MSTLTIVVLDNCNKVLEETSIQKPETYERLRFIIENQLEISSYENIKIFYRTENDKEIIISNNDEYQKIKNIIFVLKKENLSDSTSSFKFALPNINLGSLKEKYFCIICRNYIKNESPYFCYICQKVFHTECLSHFDKICREGNKNLNCPNCRNELKLDK